MRRPTRVLENSPEWVTATRRKALQMLRSVGLIPERPEALGQIEGAVQGAFSPIHPPAQFRESLRQNLMLAAQQRSSGLSIEYPTPVRESIILGVSAGVLAALVAVLVLVLRSRATASAGH
ncbi:MAG: hypothetical protein ACOX9A_03910 [Anaerolineae bacterium]|jgi:hypothetical protein